MKNSNHTQRKFEGILDRYFEGVLEDHPVMANELGLRAGEGRLGEMGLGFERRQEMRRQQTLAELGALAVNELSSEQHLDRLALRSMVLAECEDFDRRVHRLEPDAVDRVFGSLLHAGCIGHLPEVLDGDAPHTQRGCDAQAWSVSEAYRVWKLLNEK